jgi:hypothetical protein
MNYLLIVAVIICLFGIWLMNNSYLLFGIILFLFGCGIGAVGRRKIDKM